MKIVFDCERMKYPYTGLFEYCHKLATSLIENKEDEDEIQLYIKNNNAHLFNSTVKKISQRSLDKIIFPKINNDINVWHTTYQTSWYIPPAYKKLKRILTVHDLNFLYEEKSPSKKAKYLRKHQANINQADHIIAISEFTKQDILKNLKVKAPISVIYNGSNLAVFPDFDNPIYKPKKPFIFSIGTVIAKKNFHTIPCLLVNNELELIISGKENTDYVEKILNEAIKYNVLDRVKITGPITDEDKYWYFKNCKAFVFPSLAEGFGIPVIEAMSFGKPTFLSNLTSLPEIGGDVAYYFENFKPSYMQNVFEKGMQHYKDTLYAEKIKQHAEKFTWEKCAEEHLKLYKVVDNY